MHESVRQLFVFEGKKNTDIEKWNRKLVPGREPKGCNKCWRILMLESLKSKGRADFRGQDSEIIDKLRQKLTIVVFERNDRFVSVKVYRANITTAGLFGWLEVNC